MDFNPPSPCGEGPVALNISGALSVISIHPPRVGRDVSAALKCWASPDFNPPSPCGEGRAMPAMPAKPWQFQSTLPVWGGTYSQFVMPLAKHISIHPPRVGRDVHPLDSYSQARISIHPPRVGRDHRGLRVQQPGYYFNPPSPCGEGPPKLRSISYKIKFQSTLPVRGGTASSISSLLMEMNFNPPSP